MATMVISGKVTLEHVNICQQVMNVSNLLSILLTGLTSFDLVHSASLFGSQKYDLVQLDGQREEAKNGEGLKYLFNDNKMDLTLIKKRPSLKDRVTQIIQNSPLSSPRTSESSTSSPSSSPRNSLRKSLTKLLRSSSSSRDSTASDESNLKERNALSDERGSQIISSLIDFESVQPINWDDIDAEPSLPGDFEAKMEGYLMFTAHRKDKIFKEKVRKALQFIDFPLNPFILNLAINMVQKFDNKAPNALKLFLESRFSVMKQINQANFAKSVESYVSNSIGYNAELFKDPTFLGHVETLFLDVFSKEDGDLYDFKRKVDILFITYMELFNNVKVEADFLKRVAIIVKILMKICTEAFPGATLTNDRIENILIHRFDRFEDEINNMFEKS